MNKENRKGKGAAGLRRSAMVERIRLREEWSALKETDAPTAQPRPKLNPVLGKHHTNLIHRKSQVMVYGCETLRGVVALVETGGGARALALRAALAALGASVAPRWSPLVTHLVWAEGGCRATRARARALAARLVSPLWVEACAAAARRLPERAFPAAARPSDLPSPRTLQSMLKRAEAEGMSLSQVFPRERCLDTSRDSSPDPDSSIDPERRVNTNPRGGAAAAHPHDRARASKPHRSRRKLFTQRERASGSDEHTEEESGVCARRVALQSPGGRRALARAERLARRLVRAPQGLHTPAVATKGPSVVLTGMSHAERQAASAAVRAAGGRLQRSVTRKTTHVLLGECNLHHPPSGVSGSATLTQHPTHDPHHEDNQLHNDSHYEGTDVPASAVGSALTPVRTLKALEGAARGCLVLRAQWAVDSARAARSLHPQPYHVPQLHKLAQKARAERLALGLARCEYAYDVFCGMRVRLGRCVEQRDACVRLLTLCGAVVVHHDGTVDKGVHPRLACVVGADECDVTVGAAPGEVAAKWVFDSVAATRMRTTRRYTNTTGQHTHVNNLVAN